MNFRERFLVTLPEIPSGLDLGLDKFVTYDESTLSILDNEDSKFLNEFGMPANASPFLSFHSYSTVEISELYNSSILNESYFPFGANGSGDILAIDLKTKEVVYFNHDSDNERVFINSSLNKFAESLCIFQQCLTNSAINTCALLISKIDPSAVRVDTMWHCEIQSEIEDR